MTDYEMKKAIFAWVKQKPARRLKLLKQWRKDLQNDFIDGVFDPIGEVPTVGDRAFPFKGTDLGTIEYITSSDRCTISFPECNLPDVKVYIEDLHKNVEENRWEFYNQKATRD